MTSLLASRRRAEEFARHLDEGRGSHDPTLAPLLEIVSRLRPAPSEPAPDFCSTLRDHLMTVAADLPAAQRVEPAPDRTGTRLVPTRVRVTGMATAFAAASVLVAVAVMARGALPGDALYPVKLRLEGAQAAVATNPESRGHQHLAQSEHRLDEATVLLDGAVLDASDRGRVRLVEATLNNFTREFRTGAELLSQAYRTEGEMAPLNRLREFTATASGRLAAIGPLLPGDLRPAYDNAMGALATADRKALAICPACGPDEQVTGPGQDDERSGNSRSDETTEPEATSTTETRTPGQTVSPDDTSEPTPDGGTETVVPTITIPGLRLPEGLEDLGLPLPTILAPDLSLTLPTALPLPAVLRDDSSSQDTDGEGTAGPASSSKSEQATEPSDSSKATLPTSSATTPQESDDPPPRISLEGIFEELRLPFL